jgi:UDP-glucose 4-epimerase
MNYVLVTGGLGFIGSHTVVELINNKYEVVICDNLSNSKINVIDKIEKITSKKIIFEKCDLLNIKDLETIFNKYNFIFVIHFASLKSVNDSIKYPLSYYNNNVVGSINLFNIMDKYNVRKIIFSSSATVYGKCNCPVKESDTTGLNISSVYGNTKFMIEEILKSLDSWSVVILRYFNPIGCHSSGFLGEEPSNTPNNLFPYILKVAIGELKEIKIYGNDYLTKDGSCVRDFIHIEDLANAHIESIKKLDEKKVNIYNVGTGIGYTVKEVLNTFEKINNIKINKIFSERREGDIDVLYSDSSKIKNELNWVPKKTLEDMCFDGFKFIKILK